MKSRLEVYYQKIPSNAVRIFKSKNEVNASPSNIYGLSLAFKNNNNFKESLKYINYLVELFPKNLVINNTKIDILLESGELEEALMLVNKFLEISPRNYPLSISKSKILLSMQEYFKSEEIIRDQLLRKNSDPELWLLLSEIQRNSKNIVGYHQSRAEYFLILGQDERALNQLEFALKLTQNNFQASERIMTKIISIKDNLKKSRAL